jgi:hypothetical protein
MANKGCGREVKIAHSAMKEGKGKKVRGCVMLVNVVMS